MTLNLNAEQRIFLDVKGSELRDVSDALQGYVYILRDISERKATEDALHDECMLAEQFAEKYREAAVRVRLHSSGKDRWGFSVIDTGVGIATEKQQVVFQPFIQIDGSNTRRKGGIGLGVSIVQKIVDLLDGEIELESETGQGASFRVTFPLEPQTEELTIA